MAYVTFITGNQNKADYLARYLGHPVDHIKLDLDEIQSLDLREIVQHKVKQAYRQIQRPVLVEDVALEFAALGHLPGPFIKWFLQELHFAGLCRLVDGKDRRAVARSVYGYYDGTRLELFEGSLSGSIAQKPGLDKGYGWDAIFIPTGYTTTRSELNEADDKKTYLQIKPLEKVKQFLESLTE
jgi:non-canonical purine NTP pyrophosphatase (RdgB/HAM1 family)